MFRKFEFDRRFDVPPVDPKEAVGAPKQSSDQEAADEHVEAERQAIRAVARAEGYDAGRAAARQEREAEIQRLLEIISAHVHAGVSDVDHYHGLLAADAVDLAYGIGEALAGEAMANMPLAMAEAAIATIMVTELGRPRLVIKVSPPDLDALGGFANARALAARYDGQLIVEADADLAPGDCTVGWMNGGVRQTRQERNKRVRAALAAFLTRPPPADLSVMDE